MRDLSPIPEFSGMILTVEAAHVDADEREPVGPLPRRRVPAPRRELRRAAEERLHAAVGAQARRDAVQVLMLLTAGWRTLSRLARSEGGAHTTSGGKVPARLQRAQRVRQQRAQRVRRSIAESMAVAPNGSLPQRAPRRRNVSC